MSDVFFSCSPPWFLRQDLSLNRKLTARLTGYLANLDLPPPVPALSPQYWGSRGTLPHPDFTWMLGNRTQVLMLV